MSNYLGNKRYHGAIKTDSDGQILKARVSNSTETYIPPNAVVALAGTPYGGLTWMGGDPPSGADNIAQWGVKLAEATTDAGDGVSLTGILGVVKFKPIEPGQLGDVTLFGVAHMNIVITTTVPTAGDLFRVAIPGVDDADATVCRGRAAMARAGDAGKGLAFAMLNKDIAFAEANTLDTGQFTIFPWRV